MNERPMSDRSGHRSPCRSLFAMLLASIALALLVIPVAAHVVLVSATPVADSVIGQPPPVIKVRFDMAPETKFAAIHVLDARGQVMAGGAATIDPSDPTIIAVPIPHLPFGLYTVAWQALAPDGHLSKGNYAFTLTASPGPAAPAEPEAAGAPTTYPAAPASASGTSGNPSLLMVVVRWWRYLALAVLLGTFGLAVLVVSPVTRERADGDLRWQEATRMLRGAALGGAVSFALAHLVTLLVQAARVTDVSLTAINGETVRSLAFDTVYGDIWRLSALLVVILVLGIALLLFADRWPHLPQTRLGIVTTARPRLRTVRRVTTMTQWPWWLGFALSLLLAGTLSLSSHAIVEMHGPVLAVLADGVHLGAMSVWFGGLLILLGALPRLLRPLEPAERIELRAALIARFSPVSLVCMVALIVTGIYAMTLHTSRDTILHASYGQTLLIKHAAIVPLLAVAASNLRVIKPRLRHTVWAQRWLPRLMGVEAAIGLVVLGLTALLTQLPPAYMQMGGSNGAAANLTTRAAQPAAPLPIGTLGPDADLTSIAQTTQTIRTAQLAAVVQTTDGQDGSALAVTVLDPTTIPTGSDPSTSPVGRQLPDVQEVYALLIFTGADLGQTRVPLAREPDGWYRATGNFFPIKGNWQMQLVIRRANVAADARLTAAITSDSTRVQPAATPATQSGFLWPRFLPSALTGALLVLVGSTLLALQRSRRFGAVRAGRRATLFGAWSVGALMIGAVVFGYFSVARTPTTDLRNPTANDAATLARGQQLFAQNCAVCHGATGHGDGPLAPQLHPRPADIAGSMVSAHTDGDLYWYISHGIPGSAMPAWSGPLSDQEIWAVARYVRSLRSGAP